jgi:hypothetical protein
MSSLKNSRKARKNSRKAQKNSRKARKNTMRQRGGAYDTMRISLAQGQQFADAHKEQHGGGMLTGAPISSITSSSLDASLRQAAGVSGYDKHFEAATGMVDNPYLQTAPVQKGGARKRKGSRKANMRKGSRKANMRKGSRKANMRKGSRKANMRKGSRKANMRKGSRKAQESQRGGALALNPATYGGPTMLLSPAQAAKAGTADFSNPLLKA